MTPEEQAVIDAALVMYYEGSPDDWASCAVIVKVGEMLKAQKLVPEWVKTTWKYVLAGDRVRLGQQEAEIERGGANDFHAEVSTWVDRETGRERDNVTGRWDHGECRFRLVGHAAPMPFDPDGEVEVLADEERGVLLSMTEHYGFTFTYGECTQRYCKICGPTLHDAQTKNEELDRPVTMQDIKADRVGPRAEYLAHQRKAANYRRATGL